MDTLIVRRSNLDFILLFLFGLFFIPGGLFFMILGVIDRFQPVFILMGFMLWGCFAGLLILILRAYLKSVKYLTNEGLTRNDGRSFMWSELTRVEKKSMGARRMGGTAVWRTETHFRDGSVAWLISSKANNFEEINDFLQRMGRSIR